MMDKPVTVAQFRDRASSSRLPAQPKWSADDVSFGNVTWDDETDPCLQPRTAGAR